MIAEDQTIDKYLYLGKKSGTGIPVPLEQLVTLSLRP